MMISWGETQKLNQMPVIVLVPLMDIRAGDLKQCPVVPGFGTAIDHLSLLGQDLCSASGSVISHTYWTGLEQFGG